MRGVVSGVRSGRGWFDVVVELIMALLAAIGAVRADGVSGRDLVCLNTFERLSFIDGGLTR